MKRFEQISRLHRLLTRKHQPPLSKDRLREALDWCSDRTVDRCIEDLRNRFGHPIVFDAEIGGYRYGRAEDGAEGWELPGLWFNESELTALLSMRHVLEQVHPGIFQGELAPLGQRIESLLEATGVNASEVAHRIRVVSIAGRSVPDRVFRACADAVLSRRRLSIDYRARGRDGAAESRDVSPQRLTRYRDNWYLDAWCHLRDGLRVFAVDAIRNALVLEADAISIDDAELNRVFKSSYGIFSGEADKQATLRFTPHRSRWVSKEDWHGKQQGRFLPDGSWELKVPYAHSEELVMDILKYGPDVEVVGPDQLRAQVGELLREATALYGGRAQGGREQSA